MKLIITLRHFTQLTPENQADEKISMDLAKKIFELITREAPTPAHGARALQMATTGLCKMNEFPEALNLAAELTRLSMKTGCLKIEVIQ